MPPMAGKAELIRYVVVNGRVAAHGAHQRSIWPPRCTAMPRANMTLQPFDMLSVKEVPLWQAQESVTLKGEVRFPGNTPSGAARR